MKTNFFFLILGICCGLICYKLYDRYFIDTGVESCREETLSELQYDEERNQDSESAQQNIQYIYDQLNSTDPKSNRSFTISKEFVAYMYFHYYNTNIGGFKFAPKSLDASGIPNAYYCLPVDMQGHVLANFGKYYLSSNLLNSPCPHSCD